VLCLLGAAAGLAVASLLIQAAIPALAQLIPYTASLVIGFPRVRVRCGIALAWLCLLARFRAANLSRKRRASAASDGRGSSTAHHIVRRSIVIAEVALSLVLVCGALLLFKSLFKLQQLQTGIRIENVITMSISWPRSLPHAGRKPRHFYESLAERLNPFPESCNPECRPICPFGGSATAKGWTSREPESRSNVRFKRVDPGYFAPSEFRYYPAVASRIATTWMQDASS